MKRKRFNIHPVADETYAQVLDNPAKVFQAIEDSQIEIPESATFLLFCLKLTKPKFDLRFFETQDDYLLDYTGCLLKDRDDYEFHSFRRDGEVNDVWEMFLPPPVVGLGIRTRLRPGLDPI